MYYYYYDRDVAQDVWNPWLAVALIVVAVCLHGVWRLWRGMRLDAFERGLRELRREPWTRLAFPRSSAPPAAPRTGWLQISLLPLMILSVGLAMLLAQLQRPDEFSRPVTWCLFVVVGALYGSTFWRHQRGVGPLRNSAWSGALGAMAVSTLLWLFYMGVDVWRGDAGYARVTASFATLLWWAAVGGVGGALLGAQRAGAVYRGATANAANHDSLEVDRDLKPHVESGPSKRSARGAIWVACVASLLFHLSAAPQLYQVVRVRELYLYNYWWNTNRPHPLTLTMAQADTRALQLPTEVVLTDIIEAVTPVAAPATTGAAPATEQVFTFYVPTQHVYPGESLGGQVRAVTVSVRPGQPIPFFVPDNPVTSIDELAGMVAKSNLPESYVVSRSQLVPGDAVRSDAGIPAAVYPDSALVVVDDGRVLTGSRSANPQISQTPATPQSGGYQLGGDVDVDVLGRPAALNTPTTELSGVALDLGNIGGESSGPVDVPSEPASDASGIAEIPRLVDASGLADVPNADGSGSSNTSQRDLPSINQPAIVESLMVPLAREGFAPGGVSQLPQPRPPSPGTAGPQLPPAPDVQPADPADPAPPSQQQLLTGLPLTKQRATPLTYASSRTLLQQLDVDGDGFLTAAEWPAIAIDSGKRVNFSDVDLNRDGKLTLDELASTNVAAMWDDNQTLRQRVTTSVEPAQALSLILGAGQTFVVDEVEPYPVAPSRAATPLIQSGPEASGPGPGASGRGAAPNPVPMVPGQAGTEKRPAAASN
ncbi:MAG: hypothetical protein KDB14_23925 [Planctomycetales bacterium]|nr:hypothetical protein [Planctomycetales bacterium]